MIHKKSLDSYLQLTKNGEAYIFTGNHAVVYVPQRYSVQDLYTQEDEVKTLAIFEVVIDGEPVPYHVVFPAIIHMRPTTVTVQKVDDVAYNVLVFNKGDVFVSSTTIVKQSFVLAAMFIEFIRNGNMPKFLKYDQMTSTIDRGQSTSGVNLPILHATLEMIIAHCCRDPDNLSVKYRHTDMKKPPVFLGLRNVTDIRDTTTSKLIGSYLMEGINSAIVNKPDQVSEIENILRA